ncbi:acetyltransferase [Seiridium cupressi]
MGTPFISILEPSKLDDYDRRKPRDQQAPSVPRTFIDAMEVRESVFVEEQGVPIDYEHDSDDSRSVHWVIYASVRQVVEQELTDPATSQVLRPRRSETRTQPIGTVRLVPFPHPPHPVPGGKYVDNVLQNQEVNTLTASQEERRTSALPYGRDAPTNLHDGKEAFIKVGRLSVIKEFRGHRAAGLLWSAAREWMVNHPHYFNPSVTELGLDALKAQGVNDIPRWKGLVCVHAQEDVKGLWEKWGFQVDEAMGKWWEEGIPHIGMFQRLQPVDVPIRF